MGEGRVRVIIMINIDGSYLSYIPSPFDGRRMDEGEK
jgi:hypothetical protein